MNTVLFRTCCPDRRQVFLRPPGWLLSVYHRGASSTPRCVFIPSSESCRSGACSCLFSLNCRNIRIISSSAAVLSTASSSISPTQPHPGHKPGKLKKREYARGEKLLLGFVLGGEEILYSTEYRFSFQSCASYSQMCAWVLDSQHSRNNLYFVAPCTTGLFTVTWKHSPSEKLYSYLNFSPRSTF